MIKQIIRGVILVLATMGLGLALGPAVVMAAPASGCPSGQVSTNNGCCPTEAAQYNNQTGSLSCPTDAQLCSDPAADQQADATGCLFTKYINPLIQVVSALVGVAIIAGIIWGGIEYITSAGDPQRAALGKKHIMNALIALVAYGLLYAFLQFMVPGGVLNG